CSPYLKNKKLSVLRANVQLSVRQDGRGLLDRAEVLKPQLFSCTQVERSDVGAVVDLIETITVNNRRRETTLPTVRLPFDLVFLNVALGCCVNGHHHPHLARIQVLLAVGENGVVLPDHRAGVQTTLAYFILPNRFTGLRFDCMEI